jgi:hypothetical protein
MPGRGSYGFEINGSGSLVDSPANFEKLRTLFRDGQIINDNWGPGNDGDFDHGSWHILCHLAAGSGVLETDNGRAWCGLIHVPASDTYAAAVTWRQDGGVQTAPLASSQGKTLVNGARCLGFIEGSSLGHISARGVQDAPDAFNGWPRQSFDKPVASAENGGTVWEHWSTTRDIRASSRIGTAVLTAYLTLASVLGGRFVAAVARGRREHSHPQQLVALVKAGLLTSDDALWDVMPDPIPPAAQDSLYEARPTDSLEAAKTLAFMSSSQRYYMFQRRIDRWSRASDVKNDLGV